MENKNSREFFRKFISMLKSDKKRIAIITDKDGTLLFNEELRETLKKLKKYKQNFEIFLIANSGRTVGDMINSLKEENIPIEYFDYIIGDNGGMAVDIKKQKQLFKYTISSTEQIKVIEEFIRIGGNPHNIRYADGTNIFASNCENAKKYYQGRNNIKFLDDIQSFTSEELTKITLCATKEQIQKMQLYVREKLKGYKGHLGKTTYSKRNEGSFLIDITGDYDKGSAVLDIIKNLNIDTAIYLGNDLNDIEMFYLALQRDEFIVVAGNRYPEVTNMINQLLEEKCKNENLREPKILVLKEENVNGILKNITRILKTMNKSKERKGIFKSTYILGGRALKSSNRKNSKEPTKTYLYRE